MEWNRGWQRGTRLARMVGVGALTFATAACGREPFALSSEAVTDHRARWEAAGVADYDYDFGRQCECLPDDLRPTRVYVRDGRVAQAKYSDSGQAAAAGTNFPTVDELFDLIDDAIQRDAVGLAVSYDGRLGYPTEITIDYDLEAADDELSIRARNLVASEDPGTFESLVAR